MNIMLKQLEELSKLGKDIRLAAEGWDKPWKTLISILLSARTRDETVIRVCNELFKRYPTIRELSNADLKDVENIIKPINFYKNKSKSVINCAKELVSKYNGDVPLEFNKLIELAGVGRKTANVFLAEYGNDEVGVDTHISYISQKLGWTSNRKPDKIEEDLKRLFPKEYWRKLNPILIKFGKTYTSRKEKDKLLEKIKT